MKARYTRDEFVEEFMLECYGDRYYTSIDIYHAVKLNYTSITVKSNIFSKNYSKHITIHRVYNGKLPQPILALMEYIKEQYQQQLLLESTRGGDLIENDPIPM